MKWQLSATRRFCAPSRPRMSSIREGGRELDTLFITGLQGSSGGHVMLVVTAKKSQTEVFYIMYGYCVFLWPQIGILLGNNGSES